MTEDRMWRKWQEAAPAVYDEIYYGSNRVVAHFNTAGHVLMERGIDGDRHFSRVLEVGAGTGQHLDFVRHRFDTYHVTDINAGLLDKARSRHGHRRDIVFELRDATRLDYPDSHFDRLVSCYNLEHLPFPHLVLREWRRVLKPGGLLTVALPTEGGLAWRLGRWMTTRRSFAARGLDLDYIIAREHINTCYNLVALLRHAFPGLREVWYPTRLPLSDVNLVFVGFAHNRSVGSERQEIA